jgi:hypothetical protein
MQCLYLASLVSWEARGCRRGPVVDSGVLLHLHNAHRLSVSLSAEEGLCERANGSVVECSESCFPYEEMAPVVAQTEGGGSMQVEYISSGGSRAIILSREIVLR